MRRSAPAPEQSALETEKRPWMLNWTDILIASLIWLVVLIGATFVLVGTPANPAGLLVFLALTALGYILAAQAVVARRKTRWSLIGLRSASGHYVALAISIGLGLRLVLNGSLVILERQGVSLGDGSQNALFELFRGSALVALAAIVVVGYWHRSARRSSSGNLVPGIAPSHGRADRRADQRRGLRIGAWAQRGAAPRARARNRECAAVRAHAIPDGTHRHPRFL
jgi:hypothetical protein